MPERVRRLARLGVTLALALFVGGSVLLADPPDQDRAEALGSRIRCPVCQGEAIADSPSGLARDMMDLVRQRIDEGATDEQIVEEILASYTGAQLLDPPLSPATVALWALPALALAAGVVLLAARRRPRRPPVEPAPADLAATASREEP